MARRVYVSVPATTSNLGPGFDVIGMALSMRSGLSVEELPRADKDEVEISGEGEGFLPRDGSNLAVRAFRRRLLAAKAGRGKHFLFRLTNRIPLCRGLGSSAAARLAGILAAEALSGGRTDSEGALGSACRLEGHPDNAVAAFFGGLCVSIINGGEIRAVRLRAPKELSVALAVPEIEVPTARARALLPARVALSDAVFTSSRLSLLTAAFEQRRWELLKYAMQDVLHQPYRARLVPGLKRVLAEAYRAGALGAALSGSGPTTLAFCPDERSARRIADAMARAFVRKIPACRTYVLKADPRGARVSQ